MKIADKKGFLNLILGMFIFFFNTALTLILMNTFFTFTEVTNSMLNPLTPYYQADAGIQRAKWYLEQPGLAPINNPYIESFDITGDYQNDVNIRIDPPTNTPEGLSYHIISDAISAAGAILRRIESDYLASGIGDLTSRT